MATSTLPCAPASHATVGPSGFGSDISEPSNGRANSADPGWTSLIVTALCRGLLVMIASMALWAVLPAALGWQVTVVMSGSMEPALRPGDVVASRPVSGNAVRPGQVVLVDDPDHEGRLRLHRLSKVTDNGQLVLRGDANRSDDSTPVRRNAVHGVGSLRVPFIGAPAYWLRTHQIAPLAPTGLAVVLIGLGAIGRRHPGDDDQHDDRDQNGTDGAHRLTPASARPAESPTETGDLVVAGSRAQLRSAREAARKQSPGRRGRWRGGLIILTAAAFTVAATVTDAPARAASAFKATAANPVSSWTAGYFTCSAAVLADSPYLYYAFSEKSGATVADGSGNGRNGTYNKVLGAGVSYGAAGPCSADASTAVTLDGTNGWVSGPGSITAPKTFTTEIWFRTTTTRGGSLISFRSPVLLGLLSSYDRQLYLDNSGRLVFGLTGDTTKTIASTRTYNDGGWHLADVTVSSTGTRLYVDGAKVGEDVTMNNPIDASGAWRVGDGGFGGWSPEPTSARPAATVHGAAVYSGALSDARIAAHYASR